MDISPEGHAMPEGGAGFVVTLADIYKITQAMNSEVIRMGVLLTETLASNAELQTRVTNHDNELINLKGQVVVLQTRAEIERSEKPAKAGTAVIISVAVAVTAVVMSGLFGILNLIVI